MAKKTYVTGEQVLANDLNTSLNWQLVESKLVSSGTSFINLGTYGEIMIIFDNVTAGGYSSRTVQVSSDNGATYYSTGYIVGASNASSIPVGSAILIGVYAFCHILLFNKVSKSPVISQRDAGATTSIINVNVALDAIVCGNSTGGTISVYGR